jgi:hypothetical protein
MTCSQGPATALPFALQILRYLKGDAAADKVASDMLYPHGMHE